MCPRVPEAPGVVASYTHRDQDLQGRELKTTWGSGVREGKWADFLSMQTADMEEGPQWAEARSHLPKDQSVHRPFHLSRAFRQLSLHFQGQCLYEQLSEKLEHHGPNLQREQGAGPRTPRR